MFVATVVVSVLVSAVLGLSAANMVRRDAATVQLLERVGAVRLLPLLATVAAAGALGLLVGLGLEVLGILAGVGVVLFMVGALIAHLRAGDPNVAPPLVIGGLAVLATILRALTA